MKSLDDPKKQISLIMNSELLTNTQILDVSSTFENALKQVLIGQHERQWKTQNQTAIQAYNDFVENNGCFRDDYRVF